MLHSIVSMSQLVVQVMLKVLRTCFLLSVGNSRWCIVI
jgi:hypothetical protein